MFFSLELLRLANNNNLCCASPALSVATVAAGCYGTLRFSIRLFLAFGGGNSLLQHLPIRKRQTIIQQTIGLNVKVLVLG
jgi:hypothetical protein